jgi:hypothetical protein
MLASPSHAVPAATPQAGGVWGTGVQIGDNCLRPLGETFMRSGGGMLMGIGVEGFSQLFQQHPNLKLFVAPRDDANPIGETGGGMRVCFIAAQ